MIKKIRTEDLQVGMFVTDFNTPWLRHPFLTNRKVLRNAREIQIVLDQGIAEVYIDTSRGKDSSKAYAVEEAEEALRKRLREEIAELQVTEGAGDEDVSEEVSFEEELRKAKEIYANAKQVVRKAFEEVRLGGGPDGEQARDCVSRMVDSIFRNRDALLSLSRLKSFDDYTLNHSLNVCVLALHLGAQLGILHDELLRLGLGAILHDLGKTRLPPRLLQKEGTLTPQEFEVMKTHAAHGASILLHCSAIPDDCALVALNHHERYDGSGYPRGLAGLSVGKFGLIAAIADVYDAMTSDRTYQRAMPPGQALKRAYEWAGTLFHPIYVRKFIQCVGIYPVGSVVCLDTGEVGVVLRQNREELLRPWVRVVRDGSGRPLPQPLDVNLRDPRGENSTGPVRNVERVLDGATVGLDVHGILDRRPARPPAEHLTVVLG
jgi:putative nucleotidyltransferase with HDIG domain